MNILERKVYDLVKKNEPLKNSLRDIYQFIFSLVPKPKKETEYSVIEREGYFYGFHDKIPWSADNQKLLAHKFDIPNRDIQKEDEVEIGYFTGEKFENFHSLAKTKSWNWQQGSMLQWISDTNTMIFNNWNGKNNVAQIIDTQGNLIKELDVPIGAIDATGKYALSYSFERLNIGMPGYGYMNENDDTQQYDITEENGITIYDLRNDERELLFSVKDIANYHPEESMNDAYHFFTHCLFAPDSSRFLFLHRWYKKGQRLKTRMISCDLNGNNLHIFPTNGVVSHITWVSNDKVFAYASTQNEGDGYFLFNDLDPHYTEIGKDQYSSDGHPQYSQANGLIVTDTYPNRYRIQELSLYNLKTMNKKVIAKLRAPLKFKDEIRCDLHPRWDRTGTMLCFDSAHNGVRSLCTIDLKE